MKRSLFLIVALASSFPIFAQTPTAPAPTPSQPVGTISGFAPNPVSGFTFNAVSGFSQNPVSGFTPTPPSPFPPGTIAPLATSIGGVGTNNLITIPANPNMIVVPQTPIPSVPQPPINGNNTNRVLLTPLF